MVDFTESAQNATGVKFYDYSARALAKAVRKAMAIYQNPNLLRKCRLNGMKADFSWTSTVKQYMKIYAKD